MTAVVRMARRVREHPLLWRGDRVQCPCCGGSFRSMLTHRGRRNARCPGCGAMERHRVLWLHLVRHASLVDDARAVLHVAPERVFERFFRSRAGLEYVATDLRERPGWLKADLTALPIEDARFDLVICNHVLEHVPDDVRAMRELRRVLAAGGTALLQHPIDVQRAETYEDWAVTTPAGRLAAFGQEDHVRVYGRDFADRLRRVGWNVEVVRSEDVASPEEARRYALGEQASVLRAGDIYVCTQ